MNERAATLPAYYSQTRPELQQLVEPRGRRVLDVGCAAGAMGAELLARGAREVVGLDVFEPALAFARERLTAAHRVDLNTSPELPYPDGHFDLITFADVLEHLVNPAAVLRHLRRWLADEGEILVSIPNVRHESVVLPLLVNGRWDYVDAGILDRTHLRFFTHAGVLELLEHAGFALEGKMATVRSGRSAYAQKAADLVAALGGDAGAFLAECDVVQFVCLARAREARAAAPPRGGAGARAGAGGPWEGSRPVRILLAPALDAPDDCWAAALPALARGVSGNGAFTLAVALPGDALAAPPGPVTALAQEGLDLDLVLTARPRTAAGWAALVGGASLLVLTSSQPELEDAARVTGVEVRDARQDPELSGAARPAA
jgi:hypothetical protein